MNKYATQLIPAYLAGLGIGITLSLFQYRMMEIAGYAGCLQCITAEFPPAAHMAHHGLLLIITGGGLTGVLTILLARATYTLFCTEPSD